MLFNNQIEIVWRICLRILSLLREKCVLGSTHSGKTVTPSQKIDMPSRDDAREEYVLNCVSAMCKLSDVSELCDNSNLKSFFNDPSSRVLAVSVAKKSNKISVCLDPSNSNSKEEVFEIHFVKSGMDEITEDNIREAVIVTPIQTSPLNNLFHALHSVYAPRLLKNHELNQGLQNLLCKLDSGLESAVRSGTDGIAVPKDEILYWEDQVSTGRGSERKRAETFSKILVPLKDVFGSLENISLVELYDSIEEIQLALEDLWKADESFGAERMTHFIHVIGSAIVSRITGILSQHDIWSGRFGTVRAELDEGSRLCERWISCIEELSDEESFKDEYFESFSRRVDDIIRARTTHEELKRLLDFEEQKGLGVESCFDVFDTINPFFCNSYTQPAWDLALVQYEKRITPIEKTVSVKLSAKIKSVFREKASNAQMMLAEFIRYKNLVCRPTMRKTLMSEREALMARISSYVDDLDSDFDNRSSDVANAASKSSSTGKQVFTGCITQNKNFSPTVNAIVWGKQLCSNIDSISTAAGELLDDLPAYQRFNDSVHGLLNRVETWMSDVFRDWVSDMEDQLADGNLSVQLTGQLMEINLNGVLEVNFSERLVTMLREVRQLNELGRNVPSKIKKLAAEAETYYRFGVMLKKTANFFNTMGVQIIESQKPMLFDALVEFEKEVTNPTANRGSKSDQTVTWGNSSECNSYVERLRTAADKLSGENRRLQKVHEKMGMLTVGLMDIDILRQSDRWKQQWGKISTIVSQLETNYEAKRMSKWKIHWDHQIYKAMEASYIMGLESLNENLGEIKTELIFANHKLQFKPPIEELRSSYYRKMKKFIAIPASFNGLSGGSTARYTYAKMTDRNSESLVHVYTKAEKLFDQLEELCLSMTPYVLLGTVHDIDALVESTCLECPDWEANFKTLKSKRRELEKVQDFYKVDCVAVSTSLFKMAVEEQLARLSDSLLLSLRKNVTSILRSVDSFLTTSLETLGKRPTSIQEISEATEAWFERARV